MSVEETPLAVTDTHALIWAIDGQGKRLGKHARRLFDRADEGMCAIYVPAHALAELGEACHSGRVMLDLPLEEWARAVFASGKYHEAQLTAENRVRSATPILDSGARRSANSSHCNRAGFAVDHPGS